MKWAERLGDKGKTLLLVLLGLAGVLCVVLGTVGTKQSEGAPAEKTFSTEAYIEQVENRIRTIVAEITGSDSVRALVCVSEGAEYVYVCNEDVSGERRSTEYLTVQGDRGTELILRQERYPKITGISVACKGGDDPETQAKVIAVLTTAFSIGSNRICIVGTK